MKTYITRIWEIETISESLISSAFMAISAFLISSASSISSAISTFTEDAEDPETAEDPKTAEVAEDAETAEDAELQKMPKIPKMPKLSQIPVSWIILNEKQLIIMGSHSGHSDQLSIRPPQVKVGDASARSLKSKYVHFSYLADASPTST